MNPSRQQLEPRRPTRPVPAAPGPPYARHRLGVAPTRSGAASRTPPLRRPCRPHEAGRRAGRSALLVCLLLAAAALPALAQTGSRDRGRSIPPPPSLAGVPGFVEFSDLGVKAPGRPTLRVALHGPLLRFVAEAARGEEPGFAELIDKLQGIFAQIYELPAGGREAMVRQTEETARLLERRGWQTVVEVHDAAGDTSFLQVRTDGDRILGLAVMFVDPGGGSAGFINVVGDITPEDVGRIGRTFDIDALERFGDVDRKEE